MANVFMVFCVLCLIIKISGQNDITFLNDQYSGVNSTVLSPTQAYLNPNILDINIFSEDIFLQNNYAYIPHKSLIGLGLSNDKITDLKENDYPDMLRYYNKNGAVFLLASDILGPAFSFSEDIGEKKYIFGLFSRLRTQTFVTGFDGYESFLNRDIPRKSLYDVNPFRTTLMNWAETGLNVATEIFPHSEKQWIIGANLKYEIGLDAYTINSPDTFQMISKAPEDSSIRRESIYPSDHNIYASNYNIDVSYATNYNFDKNRYELKANGKGFGLDLGIMMIGKDKSEDEYNYKFSFNITDLGMINFDSGIKHHFQGDTIWLQNNPVFENIKFNNPEQVFKIVSKEIYGDENASFVGTRFKIGLPTAINFGYSQRLQENHFINFNWIQRVPVFENSAKRNNILNANYSVQKNLLGYGVSASLVEYSNLQFGGYFRLGLLILGSENLFPIFFKHNHLHAASFYMALKLYPFWDSEFKRHRRKKCDCEK